MMSLIKIFFLIALFAILFFYHSDTLVAQEGGNHLCRWRNGTCEFLPGSDFSCGGGYVAGNGCTLLGTQDQCETTGVACVPDDGFGGHDEPCRTDGPFESRCDEGLVCLGGAVCRTGGVIDGPCLPGGGCGTGLYCNSENICQEYIPPEQPNSDVSCNTSTGAIESGGDGISTAIGCIPYDPVGLTTFFMGWALGIGGGIALLMISWAAIQIMTSSGDPKKVQAGQQLLTAAISGLLLIILSTFILRLLGVNILNIF